MLASYGHVRDLPSKNGSVEPDKDFEMHWDVEPKAAKLLDEIAKAVKGASKLILATDPDREGEAISWHVYQVLNRKKALDKITVERVVFNAVTKEAVLEAMRHPREIDGPLVNAYLARRALDYLVGFTLSPVLWRKLPGARSAGRVQSVALRLVCDREAEIEKFKAQEYWSLIAELATDKAETFSGPPHVDRRQEAREIRHCQRSRGDAAQGGTRRRLLHHWRGREQIAAPPSGARPSPPRRCSRRPRASSGLSPRQTMQLAQRLYEGVDLGGESEGLITYMRTDGVQIAPEAISACRRVVEKLYGKGYVPASPRQYETKAKNAQEAHEAIRPTDFTKSPDSVARYLDADAAKLYKLVWQRTLASQTASAEIERTTADIEANGKDGVTYGVRATGQVIRFDGFLKVYEEGTDDAEGEDGARLPVLTKGDPLRANKVNANQHFTEPPPRYSEASLIKKMEELGIGRPSTYASTLNILRDREYVRLDKKRLVPEDKGRLVTAFLENFLRPLRRIRFHRRSRGEARPHLGRPARLEGRASRLLARLHRRGAGHRRIAHHAGARCAERHARTAHLPWHRGRWRSARLSVLRHRAAQPEDRQVRCLHRLLQLSRMPLHPAACRQRRQAASLGSKGKPIGIDPVSGLEVTLRSGRFGPYVQLGENGGEKPKRASLPKGSDPESIDLDRALDLLSLPREVGLHPESGKPITAGFGRFGPYVQHDGKYASLSTPEEVFTVGINRAVSLLAEKAASRGRRGASVIKDLGEYPELGGAVQVLSGRYGPYVKHGKVNATLPKDRDPEAGHAAGGRGAARRQGRQGTGEEACPQGNQSKEAEERESGGRGDGKLRRAHRKPPVLKPNSWLRRRLLPRPNRGQAPSEASDPRLPARLGRAYGQARDRACLRHQGRRPDCAERVVARHGRRRADRRLAAKTPTSGRVAIGHGDRDRRARHPWRVHRPSFDLARGDGPPPRILVVESKQDKGPPAGIGDRVLARITALGASADIPFQARPIKRLPRATRSQLGIFRELPAGGGVIDPVDRKQLKEWRVTRGATQDAENGELVRFELAGAARFGAANVRVTERLGNPQDQRATSLIAIHAHGIPDTFPEAVLSEAETAVAPDLKRREDLGISPSSPSIRQTPATATMRYGRSPTRIQATKAAG